MISETQLYPLRTEKRYSSLFNKQQPPEIGASCLAPDKATAVKPQLKPQRENGWESGAHPKPADLIDSPDTL